MRLLYTLHRSPQGIPAGTEHHLIDLVTTLREDVEPLLFYPEGEKVWLGGRDGGLRGWAPYERPHTPFVAHLPTVERFFTDSLIDHRVELVHFQHLLNLPTSLPGIAAERGIPYVVSIHDYYFWCVNYTLLKAQRFCGFESDVEVCRRCLAGVGIQAETPQITEHRRRMLDVLAAASAIVCPSEYVKNSLLAIRRELSASNVHVIEHGTDAAAAPVAAPRAPGPLRVAFLGSFAPQKGSHYFRDIVQAFKDRRDVEFFVIGIDWSEPDDRFWTTPNLRKLGPYARSDVTQILRRYAIDLVLLLSPWPETFSYTLSEAILAGTPVVATDLGAVRERVSRYGVGFLIEADHPLPRLMRLLDDLAVRPARLEPFKARCLAAADRLSTTTAMAREYLELYRRVLGGHAGAAVAAAGSVSVAKADPAEPYPTASVIIPNWNGAHLLPTCLDALGRQTLRGFDVIVVDNGSRDGSLDLLARDYPHVATVALQANHGFARAINEGIRRSNGDIVVLLNNDTEPEPSWLEELLRALHEHPRAGAAASKLLLYDRRHVLHTAGDYYVLDGMPGNSGVLEEDRGQYDGRGWIFGACGAAAAYRRAMLDEIGLFDEDFFAYCEDVDLAWRAQLAGYACLFVPTARVYHRVSATGGGATANYYWGRNVLFVLAKDYPTSLLRKHWRAIARRQLGITLELLGQLRQRESRARLKGQLVGILTFPRILRKRRQVQRLRRVADPYLESLLHPYAAHPRGLTLRRVLIAALARLAPRPVHATRKLLWIVRIAGWRTVRRAARARLADLAPVHARREAARPHQGRLAEALAALAEIYLARGDLQVAFPWRRNGVHRELLEWASRVADGHYPDSDHDYLRAYAREYADIIKSL